jgi:hypothetical protein
VWKQRHQSERAGPGIQALVHQLVPSAPLLTLFQRMHHVRLTENQSIYHLICNISTSHQCTGFQSWKAWKKKQKSKRKTKLSLCLYNTIWFSLHFYTSFIERNDHFLIFILKM